jgi:hypothetical protein
MESFNANSVDEAAAHSGCSPNNNNKPIHIHTHGIEHSQYEVDIECNNPPSAFPPDSMIIPAAAASRIASAPKKSQEATTPQILPAI